MLTKRLPKFNLGYVLEHQWFLFEVPYFTLDSNNISINARLRLVKSEFLCC